MSIQSGRPQRFIGGVTLLGLVGLPMTLGVAQMFGLTWPFALATFFLYLLIQSILMLWLFGILFQEHEMRKFRIGIGAMLILTSMISLPFGTASIYRSQLTPGKVQVAEQEPGKPQGREAISPDELAFVNAGHVVFLYLSLFPLLLVLEAVMAWYLALRQRRSPPVANH
jgi:hypothetical protein